MTQPSDFTRINAPRVEKILGILDQIEKSARSQRVSGAELTELVGPVARRVPVPLEAEQPRPEQPEPDAPKPSPVADPAFETALEAIRTMPHGRIRQVTDAVPELLVVPVITGLVYRLRDLPAAPHKA